MTPDTFTPRYIWLGTCVSSGYSSSDLLKDPAEKVTMLQKAGVTIWEPAKGRVKDVAISPPGTTFEYGVILGTHLKEKNRHVEVLRSQANGKPFAENTPEELAIHMAMNLSVEKMTEIGASRLVVMHPTISRPLPDGPGGEWLYTVEAITTVPKKGEKPQQAICLNMICVSSFSGALASDYGFTFLKHSAIIEKRPLFPQSWRHLFEFAKAPELSFG